MAFDEGVFRANAEAKGFSTELIDSFLAGRQTEPTTPAAPTGSATPAVQPTTTVEAPPVAAPAEPTLPSVGTEAAAPAESAEVADGPIVDPAAPPAPAAAAPTTAFDEVAFRERALAQGKFTPEQIDTFIAAKKGTPVETAESPVSFAEPTLVTSQRIGGPVLLDPEPAKLGVLGTKSAGTPVARVSDERVQEVATSIGADPTTKDGINAIYSHIERQKDWAQDKTELLANLQELVNVDRPLKWIASKFDSAADAEYASIKQQNVEAIAKLAEDRGITLLRKDDQYFIQDSTGGVHRATPGAFQSLGLSKFEALGGISGAIAGSRLGGANPLARLGFGTLGAVGGAVLGEEVDYLSSAITAQETVDSKLAMEKALGAAQTGVVFEIGGLALAKASSTVFNTIRGAYRLLTDGNTAGAFSELKTVLGYLDDAEVEEIIKRWEATNEAAAPGASTAEQAMRILPTTTAGGEAVVAAAAKVNPRVISTLKADLNNRAKTVQELVKSPLSTPLDIRQGLNDYTTQVKTSYDIVKGQGSDIVPPNFTFDLRDKSLRPLLEETIDEISNPAVVERLTRVLTRIDDLTASRTFDDLLELRQLLNEFKFANKVTSSSKFKARQGIDASLREVDAEIKNAMQGTDAGKQWLSDWKDVNSEYSKFKMVQRNSLFKAITKEGANPKTVASALIRHGSDLDTTFTEVMEKLPIRLRAASENEIVDQLVSKFTKGSEGGFNAIDFPALSKELSTYPLTTAKATQMKEGLEVLAETYKNDPALMNLGVSLSEEGGQGLFISLWTKMKVATADKLWRFIQRAKPGARANVSSLVHKAAKFLDEPLNKDAAKKVFDSIKDDATLTASMKRLQEETAKAQASGKGQAFVKLFKDRRGRLYFKPGTGRTAATTKIPPHRVANGEEVASLLGRTDTSVPDEALKLTKLEKAKLIDLGYSAIGLPSGRLLLLL